MPTKPKSAPKTKFARPLPRPWRPEAPVAEAGASATPALAAPFLLRAVPLEMWREIVARAKRNRRSINSELIVLLESAIEHGIAKTPGQSAE